MFLRILKFISVATVLAGSFATASTISKLKAGDVLTGTDVLSGQVCSLNVLQADRGTKTVQFSLGAKIYPAIVLKNPGTITWHYTASYSKMPYHDPRDNQTCTQNIEASLTDSVFSGKVRYAIYQVNWCEHFYKLHDPTIDCQRLKLK